MTDPTEREALSHMLEREIGGFLQKWPENPGTFFGHIADAILAAGFTRTPTTITDEHHTMDELYDYRMAYNANAARAWLADGIPVVKSWKHSDGEPCFGGGWFIVVAQLATGQVSNHYPAKDWKHFNVPEVDVPPEWDGHTPPDALERLLDHASLAHPVPTVTDEQVEAFKQEWEKADREGDAGNRVRRGLRAALEGARDDDAH